MGSRTGSAGFSRKVVGTTECTDSEGNLLVAFTSEDAKDFWGNLYQAERIKYAMRHRRDQIPMYLRTGEKPEQVRVEALKLLIKNLLRR